MNVSQTAMTMAASLQGRSFVLVMEHDRGKVPDGYKKNPDISFHPRDNQPCWGELRKYKKTNEAECTQPVNVKPGDLWHSFPSGKPIGLAAKLWEGNGYGSQNTNRVYEALFSKEHSPFAKGIGTVEFMYDSRKNINGFFMSDLSVDPTVLVHMLRKHSYFHSTYAETIRMYKDAGLTWREALSIHTVNNYSPIWNGWVQGYHGKHSLQRLLEANPQDLSGGTFEDRVDYNRTLNDEIFMNGPEGEEPWGDLCTRIGIHKYGSLTSKPLKNEDIVPLLKVEFDKITAKKKTLRPLHVWTLPSGKTNQDKKAIAG